jgi:hypothetical protein
VGNVRCRAIFWLAAVVLALLLPGTAAFAAGPGSYSQEPIGNIRWSLALPSALVLTPQAGEGIPALVAEGVAFFVSIIVFYFFVGTAAGFVEAQWGATIGSPGKAGSHLAGKIGQLALAVVLALLVYPLVHWITGVLLESL